MSVLAGNTAEQRPQFDPVLVGKPDCPCSNQVLAQFIVLVSTNMMADYSEWHVGRSLGTQQSLERACRSVLKSHVATKSVIRYEKRDDRNANQHQGVQVCQIWKAGRRTRRQIYAYLHELSAQNRQYACSPTEFFVVQLVVLLSLIGNVVRCRICIANLPLQACTLGDVANPPLSPLPFPLPFVYTAALTYRIRPVPQRRRAVFPRATT